MKTYKKILSLLVLSFFMTSCSSDDSDNNSSGCGNILDQPAQGTFKGLPFVFEKGTHRLQFGEYFCRIYVFDIIGGDCLLPDFGGNEGVILFGLPNLEPQTLTLSDESGEVNTLNFNSQSIDPPRTLIELAKCGQIEIISSTSTTVTGRLIAESREGSTINGNFTLDLCTE